MSAANLLSSIFERASVRDFDKNRRVPKEDLRKILVAGIRAPSAGNIQPRTFIVVKDEKVKEKTVQAVWEPSVYERRSGLDCCLR
jgi:nitroreductase